MVLSHLILYLGAFVGLWFGAGLIVASVDKISKKLGISTFVFSFFILGLFTSIPEFAVGMTAVATHKPDVFVGNLIGGIPVIFLFIIPILAILGGGIKLQKSLDSKSLFFIFGVLLAPALFVIDKRVTNIEGIVMIFLYLALFIFIQRDKGVLDTDSNKVMDIRSYSYNDMLKVLFGVVIVFITSNIIVDNTLFFANTFSISTFYISLIFLSLGTNLPELSLAVRAILSGKKDIAFGDYIGSAAANTLLFGIFTLLSNGEVITANNFIQTFVIIVLGLGAFFYFSRSNRDISRKEGFLLFLLYIVFFVVSI